MLQVESKKQTRANHTNQLKFDPIKSRHPQIHANHPSKPRQCHASSPCIMKSTTTWHLSEDVGPLSVSGPQRPFRSRHERRASLTRYGTHHNSTPRISVCFHLFWLSLSIPFFLVMKSNVWASGRAFRVRFSSVNKSKGGTGARKISGIGT